MDEYGEADAYGHRKKVDIGHALADELQRRTGEETIESDLTYDLRSGEPDAIDQIVAITYANIALDLIRDGVTGTHGRRAKWLLRLRSPARIFRRRAQSRRRHPVQHRTLSPQLHCQTRRPAALRPRLKSQGWKFRGVPRDASRPQTAGAAHRAGPLIAAGYDIGFVCVLFTV